MQTQEIKQLTLELGDVIKIFSSSNTDINNKTFFIKYIDKDKCKLIDIAKKEEMVLNITESEFDDKSIETIEIISRPTETGFARQNNLLPGKWISINFGGDEPLTINGQITDLEKDMIEISLWPNSEKIYIDFAYKGIPEDLPIKSIIDFKDPTSSKDDMVSESKEGDETETKIGDDDESKVEEDDDNLVDEFYQSSKLDYETEQKTEQRNIEIIQADQIVFGESFDEIEEIVIVPESERRYTIENQTNDLLDDLLSTVPSIERTKTVMNDLHKMVERFKELRLEYSTVDDKTKTIKIKKHPKNYKPILNNLLHLDKKINWILPICKTQKYIYDFEIDEDEQEIGIKQQKLYEQQTNAYDTVLQYKENTIPSGENKYIFLNKTLDTYFNPYELSELDSDIIIKKEAIVNIESIVSNLSDFTSYALEGNITNEYTKKLKGNNIQLSKQSFILQKALSKTAYKMDDEEITINDGEKINIIGFLTLPYSVINYSNINLPKTSIYNKARLDKIPFYYKNILKNRSGIKNNVIEEEEISKTTEDLKIDDSYLTSPEVYLFSQENSLLDRENKTYNNFLNNILPSTIDLFNNSSKYMKNATSLYTILKYLQPFMIFSNDLTYKLYEVIVNWLDKNIPELKKAMVQSQREFSQYINYKYGKDIGFKNSFLFNTIKDEIKDSILQSYHLNKETTSEFIRKLLVLDNGSLYMNALSLTDIELFVDEDIDKKIQDKIGELKEPDDTDDKDCKNFIISKAYIDFDELNEDNDREDVYFDKKYDETRYDIIEEFKEQQDSMDKNEFREFLINHLINNIGLTGPEASIDADAMINKKRKVSKDNYAYLLNEEGSNIFYKRTADNKWLHDKELDVMAVSKELFCNLKKSCISINKQCGNILINKEKIKKHLINEMLSNFENQAVMDNEKLTENISKEMKHNLIRIFKLSQLDNYNKKKYDLLKKSIANSLEDREIVISEYSEIRDIILSQDDFVEKQNNILKFIEIACRPANSEKQEDKNWFYCIKSNVKLLPTFYEKLAKSFLMGTYEEELDRVAAERGELSDDGDKIVDKHSGFYIKNIEFDLNEGYDEGGYKIVSRAVIDPDIADKLITSSTQQSETAKSVRGKIIYNILLTLQKQMSISISSEVDFIISKVENMIDTYLPSKKDYLQKIERAKKKGKKISSYEDLQDELILYITLAYFLVITQTITPPVKTPLTFRGCGPKSFKGYPVEGDTDYTPLKYLSCVILKLRSSTRPWNRIPKISRKNSIEVLKKLMGKIKDLVDSKILIDEDIKYKIQERKIYDIKNEETEIIEEFNVNKWESFLPPLFSFKITDLQNISSTFNATLEQYIKDGDIKQFNLINKLKGKIKLFSLLLQEKIQKGVDESVLLLENIHNELLVSNACCNEGNKNTLLYFIEKENSIIEINNIVNNLENIQLACELLTQPLYLVHDKSTKLKYPKVSKGFSEKVIYKFIIKNCQFNTGINISEKYKFVCGENTSSFKESDSILDKIDILKQEGKNYTIDNFIYLMDLINKKNIINIDANKNIYTERDIFIKYINNEGIISNLEYSYSLIDFFKLLNETIKTSKQDNLDLFLKQQINQLLLTVNNFLRKNTNYNKKDEILNKLLLWKNIGNDLYISTQDETGIVCNDVIRSYIINILSIYPNVIRNKINHEIIPIPQHWTSGSQKISNTHISDIKHIIESEYINFNKYYGNKSLLALFDEINKDPLVKVIFDIINYLPFEATLKKNNIFVNKNSIFTGEITKKIMCYLFLIGINIYIAKIQNVINTKDVVTEEDESKDDISDELMLGEKSSLEKTVAELLLNFITSLQSTKKLLNITNKEINEDVLKSKEKEKAKITKKLGDLSVDERRIADLMKNHRLGEWGVGQTRALYIYDDKQYDKERKDMEQDAINEYNLNKMDAVTERNKEIFKMDILDERMANQEMENEINSGIMAIADDDDYDDDRDEMGYSSYINRD